MNNPYNVQFTDQQIADVRGAALALADIFGGKVSPDVALSLATDGERAILHTIINLGMHETPGKPSVTNRKIRETAAMLNLRFTQALAWDLNAGSTCPFAGVCKAWAVVGDDGRRTLAKSPDCEYVCYAAGDEVQYTNTYNLRKHNTDSVKVFAKNKLTLSLAAWLLASLWNKSYSLRKFGGIVRWHSSGDFFNKTYTEASALVQFAAPEIEFFGYSKSPWVVEALTNDENGHMVFSHGSKFDAVAEDMGLPTNFVRIEDGQYADLPTACATSMEPNDYNYIKAQESFVINVH
jgi:hypothetical protein